MYKKQQGVLPVFFKIASAFLVLIIFSNIYQLLTNGGSYSFSPFGWIQVIILPNIVFLFILFFVEGFFPEIKLSKTGIKYRTFLRKRKLISWQEIDELIRLSRPKILLGYYVILVDRKGFQLPFNFKGLYFEYLQGIALGVFSPLIIISPNMLNTDELGMIKSKEYYIPENNSS